MDDTSAQTRRPRGPRLYHKKSRTGCIRCKQRRVKCDEGRPSCGGCSRHVVECVYPSQVVSSASGKQTPVDQVENKPAPDSTMTTKAVVSPDAGTTTVVDATLHPSAVALLSPPTGDAHLVNSSICYPSPSSSNPMPVDDSSEPDLDLPEGAWRRLWELRLLHNQHTKLAQPFSSPQSPAILQMWGSDIPNLALCMAQKHGRRALLYITFAQSALNLWTRSTDKEERAELAKLQATYQLMCSKEQRRDIDELSHGGPQHADYVCFTSVKILAHSLALVQTLSLDPWEPPTQWLHMGHGAGKVFETARNLIKPDSNSYIQTFINSPPNMRNPADLVFSDHSPLDWLLEHPAGPNSAEAHADRELDDQSVRSVYEQALSYTCSVQRAIDRFEPQYAIVRRLGGFAVWVPIEFSRFIEERRPRALVILAHFMALWLDHEDVWIVGKAGEWQIRCIYKALPLKWASKLDSLFARFKPPRPR
ncbi:hypothetical protein F5X96DRAFT_260209 [Biscogniauxia mediterranea]|nr:hypothetical protein F5X96DRAFT_260209 [Biscogniauxia mediterranea]